MNREAAKLKNSLEKLGQSQLFQQLVLLPMEKQSQILQEIKKAKEEIFLFLSSSKPSQRETDLKKSEPLQIAHKGTEADFQLGEKTLQDGKVAICYLAGGMGTRFGCDGPKGCCSISFGESEKSLFQIACEKILAAQQKYQQSFFLVIMTSEKNHQQTINFFQVNNFFGLKEKQIQFFTQSQLPFTDDDNHFFMESETKLSTGPSGNGAFYKDIKRSGTLALLEKKGVKHLQVLSIDNPLADPFELKLIGTHVGNANDISITVIDKKEPHELMGALLLDENNRIKVVEYLDLQGKQTEAKLFNVGIYCLTLDFIKQIQDEKSLPLHKTKKEATIFKGGVPQKITAWKYEAFIFEGFDMSDKIGTLLIDREMCFSPLKNKSGENSLSQVQRDLLKKEKTLYEKLTRHKTDKDFFELEPRFSYPTKEFLISLREK